MMKMVAIGGHSRNIGKTSLMAEMIHRVRPPEWTAVKITQYGHGVCSLGGEPCLCDPGKHGFVLTEEKERNGNGDTCRFLKRGARRSLWLSVRQGQLHRALPVLQHALRCEEWVMIESNSILAHMQPSLYLFVLDGSQGDFKMTARRYLRRANAFIQIGPAPLPHRWPGVNSNIFTRKPIFQLTRPDEISDELITFVRGELNLGRAGKALGREDSKSLP